VRGLKRLFIERYKIIAKEIVWKELGGDYGELDALLSSDLIKHGAKDQLKRLFMSSRLHGSCHLS
jgi:hypothetical protein